ncbi:MAG: PspC domain-containing protein [Prolixibacteraceae bacterium]|nr:PspC domain-containing protein [Prolixibacteraceae bacterium]
MKKTFTINIRGTIFHIEEDAYEALQDYLMNLKNHFGSDEDGEEILADIEARIAEIFLEKTSDNVNVITLDFVQQIILIMGTPEDFIDDDEEKDDNYSSKTKRERRFYRDPDHRVFAGVCSGMSAYFNMDPVILRIIFVILFFVTTGAALLAYIILWIAVPKAKTTSQRLEMKGHEATVKNIEKSIREEVKGVKESYNKFKSSDTFVKSKKSFENAGDATSKGVSLFFKGILILLGVAFIAGGFIGLLGMISSVFIGETFLAGVPGIWDPGIHIPGFLNYFVTRETVTLGIILIGVVACIPLLAMLYIGSKLVFRFKSNSAAIGLSLIGIWLISLFAIAVLAVTQVGNFKSRSSVATNEIVQSDSCPALYLKLADDNYKHYDEVDIDINNFKVFTYNDEEIILGQPKLDIEKADGDRFLITVRKVSRGRSGEDAGDNAKAIVYRYTGQDSVLFFDPFFSLGENRKWRGQEVFLTVKVPEGKAVYLDKSMDTIISNIENVSNLNRGDLTDRIWELKPGGLSMKKLPQDTHE